PPLPAPIEPVTAPEVVPTPLPTMITAESPPSAPPRADAATGPLLPGRRFNVLLLGSDNDLKFAANAVLTQAMILVSIDPATHGGIDRPVKHPILDEVHPDDLNTNDPYAYFRLYIPAGPQHLDGTKALQYVRSRHGDFLSDFGRSQRQQQVLVAIKNRVETMSAIAHVPRLVAALEGSVKTDLSVPALVQLAALPG